MALIIFVYVYNIDSVFRGVFIFNNRFFGSIECTKQKEMNTIFVTEDNEPVAYPNQCIHGYDTKLNYHCIQVKDLTTYKGVVPAWYSTRQRMREAFEKKKLEYITKIKAQEIKF